VDALAHFLPRYRAIRYRAFSWRYGLSAARQLALAFAMAAVTGLLAQVRLPLPFTQVPVTGSTLGVLLAGAVLGARYAAASQVIYVALGTAGLPWFTGFSGGLAVLQGVTGGYLVGFILAAELLAVVNARYVRVRAFWPQVCLMACASALILACGALHLRLVLHLDLKQTLWGGVLPFIPGDAFKTVLAASLSTALLPKTAYNGEVDGHLYPHEPKSL
jgi:biotin transport system substrate-specific component